MYAEGDGIPKNYEEALKWFRLSAEQGNIGAKTNLGWMHDYGYGVPQDRKEAIRLYRHSAELGNIYAQYNLGIINDNGEGVPQDYNLAHMWWTLSGSQGLEDAVENRRLLEKEMTPDQIAEAQKLANEWMEKNKGG